MRVHAARYLIAVVIAGTLGVLGGAGHANWRANHIKPGKYRPLRRPAKP
jgi:hypothetical protein